MRDYDKLLRINTSDAGYGFHSSPDCHRYEATSYESLELLFSAHPLSKFDHAVDFGCGKGRLLFYLHHRFGCKVTGIEMSQGLYQSAMDNLASYSLHRKSASDELCLHLTYAEVYRPSPDQNIFYMFNPFSTETFCRVLDRIHWSVAGSPREALLILYYPSEEYIYILSHHPLLHCISVIPIPNDSDTDPRERFEIWKLTPADFAEP